MGKKLSRLYYDLQLYLHQDWWKIARAYEADPDSFYNAWQYLDGHPIYWRLNADRRPKQPLLHMAHLEHENGFGSGGVWMSVAKVHPKTKRHTDDPALNTRTEVWLETGEWSWVVDESRHIGLHTHYHNYKLDCGGATYEEAVVKMARNVHRVYGNDRQRCEPGYGDQKRLKAEKQHEGRVHITVNRPYAHACRHRYPSGIEGILQQAQEEVSRGKGDA
jgi:hypothetical protein